MALGDITILAEGYQSANAAPFNTASGATAINAGEPVAVAALNSTSVIAAATSTPLAGSLGIAGLYVGVAATTSTQTATANGFVNVYPIKPGVTYLIAPNVPATWNTQTKYNDLVNSRVTLNLTNGVYTINSTDNLNNGCVVMPLDITKYPGKVAFQFKSSTYYAS